MSDLNFQDLSTVQNKLQIQPRTFAAAATIAPTTFLTFLTGTTQVATITPPTTGPCMLMLVFTDASPGVFLTSGNVKTTIAPTQNVPVIVCYDPLSVKWWGGELKTT